MERIVQGISGMNGSQRPLIIIGAPRSGTNMLRDAITSLPGFGTWPCDEINYIWRHGNIHYQSDEFTRDMARPEVRNYIRNQFDRIARKHGFATVVEKTCANSLRVGFVDEILPDARFLFVTRDGMDAVGSALLRWKAPLDIPYLARKVRYIPISDVPYHAARYFGNRLHRLWSREKRLAFWGPQFGGLEEALRRHTLTEVCALQWQACVRRAEEDFRGMDQGRVLRISYEDFVHQPEQHLREIAHFMQSDVSDGQITQAAAMISDRNIGKGRASLMEEARRNIHHLIGEDLQRYGYPS